MRQATDKVSLIDAQLKHARFELEMERKQNAQNDKLQKSLADLKVDCAI